MDTNTTRFPWLKEVPLEMQIFVKSIDFFQAIILLGSVIGMYHGIEINHPGMSEIFISSYLNFKLIGRSVE